MTLNRFNELRERLNYVVEELRETVGKDILDDQLEELDYTVQLFLEESLLEITPETTEF